MNSLQERRLNSRFDHAVYGLKPKHHHNAQAATLNDDLPYQIAAGNVVIKPNIRRMTETGVEFEDGSVVDDIDIVVYATGYVFGFPFMNHPAFVVENNQVSLFIIIISLFVQQSIISDNNKPIQLD